MKRFFLISIMMNLLSQVHAQYSISGKVLAASDHSPLPGALIRVQGSSMVASANTEGIFSLRLSQASCILEFSYVGYKKQIQNVSFPLQKELLILLQEDAAQLGEVVVSTGYQDLPAGQATGSYSTLNRELLNRRVSTDILSRLEDLAPGLLFNRGKGAVSNDISIRGMSTIYANRQPLIVLDNFPYNGDLSAINPNDIESITVLKDAAAASIWGARAGNGVIVITSKRAGYNRKPKLSFNSNLSTAEKPDLYYQPKMSSAEYIDVEKMLFARNYYRTAELSTARTPLSPAVELLIAHRDGKISSVELSDQLDALSHMDVRSDYEKYFYREGFNQQYSLGIDGGTENQRYYLSAGYDHNLQSLQENSYSRITLNAGNAWQLLKKKLELSTGLLYTGSTTVNNNSGSGLRMSAAAELYPYAQLADENGNPLPLIRDYRSTYIQGLGNSGLLDWQYRPLEELTLADNRRKGDQYQLNTSLKYRLLPYLNARILYQYSRSSTEGRNLQSAGSYYTRNLVNLYTQVSASSTLQKIIPEGGILDRDRQEVKAVNARAQLDLNKDWQEHHLDAIAGWEMRDVNTEAGSYRLYGYDDEHSASGKVDYTGMYKMYHNPAVTAVVPNFDVNSSQTDRFLSWYFSGGYSWRKRYILSASARTDQSNLFGVKANQKGIPLWSAGLGWLLSDEPFYRLDFLPRLKLRFSYGYNGNVDKSTSAYTTARIYGTSVLTGQQYAQITNPPNPELHWERVKISNAGLDFAIRGERLSGSFEYYTKRGIDLIGNIPYAPSAGISTFRGNAASTRGEGIDLALNAIPVKAAVQWTSALLLSYNRDRVTDYKLLAGASSYVQYADGTTGPYPRDGKPLYALYSYRWAGLDPATGDPQGYLNGALSKDYAKIISSAAPDSLVYHGPARPVHTGTFRNTFSWKAFSLSASISWRLGYYFRRQSVNYAAVLSGQGSHGDYSRRWQQAGDEALTSVPSLPASINTNRDNFYLYSEALVYKGDHIRLQDVSFSYSLSPAVLKKLPLNSLRIYGYANNLGILWKAADTAPDPDYATSLFPPVRTFSIGLSADF